MSSNKSKFKFISNFNSYFKLGLGDKKLTLKNYIQRFNEKWYKDPKFRLKCLILFISICKYSLWL